MFLIVWFIFVILPGQPSLLEHDIVKKERIINIVINFFINLSLIELRMYKVYRFFKNDYT